MFKEIADIVRDKTPLVHCITNYVTVNDCANILLACGASPIMADDAAEVADITSICDALCINIGTLNERTIKSMIAAGKRANELGHPVVLDPVGAGASSLRTDTAACLLEEIRFSVIRGNISEIKTIAGVAAATKGVDADAKDAISQDNMDSTIALAKGLSKKTGAVIAITGATDIVADQSTAYLINNGHPMMSKVSGTGCMLSAIIAAFVAAARDNPVLSTAAAVSAMGLCGEKAHERLTSAGEWAGTSSYRIFLIDAMSRLSGAALEGGMKVEVR